MRKPALLIIALASLALGLAGCGGDDQNVPDGAVAVVDGEQITKSEFDALINRAKTSYVQNKRPFPKVGHAGVQDGAEPGRPVPRPAGEVPPEGRGPRRQGVRQGGRRPAEAGQAAVLPGQGSEFLKELKSQGLTVDQVRQEIESQLLSEKIYEKVTSDVKVTDDEVEEYYNKHKADYKRRVTRRAPHPRREEGAGRRHPRQLENGGNFAALAKKYSTDPGSKQNGGKLTVRKGETVPEFDKVAFELRRTSSPRRSRRSTATTSSRRSAT